jgi:rare lipoprotein A
MKPYSHWQSGFAGACALFLGLALSGCIATTPRVPAAAREPAEPSGAPGGRPADADAPSGGAAGPPATPGNPPFYDVLGQRYHVMAESAGYVERGVASWYGREFHGKRTSSGETYDMYGLTAAHKTLPLPTTARVTNLRNGRSIVVRVNDRGPFAKDRLIDMSYAAARELDMLSAGTTLVEIHALPDGDSGSGPVLGEAADAVPRNAPSQRPPAGLMYVQVGAFGTLGNAEDMKRRLEQRGFANVVIRHDAGSQPALYRVRIGPIADAGEYDAVVDRVAALQVRNPRLVVEPVSPGWNQPSADGQGLPGG